jgi:hypothetical protein
VGDRGGYLHPGGYRFISIDGRIYQEHQLACLYMKGRWPKFGYVMHHINHKKDDNRWINLEEVTFSNNTQDKGMRSDNTSGFKSVGWHKTNQKWYASIMVNGKRVHLGYFESPEKAHTWYCAFAELAFGKFANFGTG